MEGTTFEIIRVYRTGDIGIEFVDSREQAEYRFYELARMDIPSIALFEITNKKSTLLKNKATI